MFDFYKIFWFMPDSVKKDITVTITLFHFFTYMYNSIIFSQKFINANKNTISIINTKVIIF